MLSIQVWNAEKNKIHFPPSRGSQSDGWAGTEKETIRDNLMSASM